MQPSSALDLERPTVASAPSSERVAAGVVAALLAAGAAAAWRFGSQNLGGSDAVFPAITAAAFVAMLVSATIARTQFRATNLPTLALLSNLFGIAALLAGPLRDRHAARVLGRRIRSRRANRHVACGQSGTPPSSQSPSRTRSAKRRSQSASTISAPPARWGTRFAVIAMTAVAVLTAAVVLLHTKLPFIGDETGFSPLFHRFVEPGLLGAAAVVLIALCIATRLRHTTSLWFAVVLVAYAADVWVGSESLEKQFSLGWYVTFAAAAVAQVLYLIVQLRNANQQARSRSPPTKNRSSRTTLRDPLTSLLNRRGFDERFEDILTEARLAGKSPHRSSSSISITSNRITTRSVIPRATKRSRKFPKPWPSSPIARPMRVAVWAAKNSQSCSARRTPRAR